MPQHEVFVSYSSIDKKVADQLCGALEQSGTHCWIAPRDVMPGKPYGEALIDAINDSKVMVLVLSGNSNHSSQVVREVERAASKGIPIIPFRVAEIRLAKSLEYFLSTCHWLDAFGEDINVHLPRLTEAVNATLRTVYDGETLPQDHSRYGNDAIRPAGPKKTVHAATVVNASEEQIYLANVVDHSPPPAHTRIGATPDHASKQNSYQPPQNAPAPPVRRNRGSNALGIAGLTASILGIFTCGTFSPIGFLLSLIGLFKAPRGSAIAGTMIGMVGCGLFLVCFAYGFFGGFTTAMEMEEAAADIDAYYIETGMLPDEWTAVELLANNKDGWQREFRYHRTESGYEIRSAGLDGAFDTADDHTVIR